MRIVSLLASLMVLWLCACSGQNDLELQQNVIGTWTGVELRPGVKVSGFETFKSDGQFLAISHISKDIVAPFDVETYGTWKVENGMLVMVTSKSNNSVLSPAGDISQDKIISITQNKLELESLSGKRYLRERQP